MMMPLSTAILPGLLSPLMLLRRLPHPPKSVRRIGKSTRVYLSPRRPSARGEGPRRRPVGVRAVVLADAGFRRRRDARMDDPGRAWLFAPAAARRCPRDALEELQILAADCDARCDYLELTSVLPTPAARSWDMEPLPAPQPTGATAAPTARPLHSSPALKGPGPPG